MSAIEEKNGDMIALTGATGMIGCHMQALLKAEGAHCKLITRAEWALSEWKTLAHLDQLFADCAAVFHFAARLPKRNSTESSCHGDMRSCFDVNVRSCLNLAEWAEARGKSVVFLSGATVYKNVYAKDIKEEAAKVEQQGFGGFYGYSKLLAEEVFNYFVSTGLKAIILRPTSVYGVGLGKDKMISKFLTAANDDQTIDIFGASNQVNLIHAADVAKAAWQAYQQKAWGTYNIAAEHLLTIQDVAQACIKVCGKEKLNICVKDDINEATCRFNLDDQLARCSFGYAPTLDIERGLGLMLDGTCLCQ